MNFYIGNSIHEINVRDENIEFSDELIGFIYKVDKQVLFGMNKLYDIDPYGDVEISKEDLQDIIKICNYLLNSSLIHDYNDETEGIESLKNLIDIAQEALRRNSGLVSIGD